MFVDAGAFGIALRQEGNVNGSSDSDSLKINMRRIYKHCPPVGGRFATRRHLQT